MFNDVKGVEILSLMYFIFEKSPRQLVLNQKCVYICTLSFYKGR